MGTAFVPSVENSLDRKISCALDKNFFFSFLSFSLFPVWFYGGRIVGKIELRSDAEIGTNLGRVGDYYIIILLSPIIIIKLSRYESFNY